MKNLICGLSLVLVLGSLAACKTVPVAGKDNVSYEVKQHISFTYYYVDLPQDIESAYKASLKGLKDLGIEPTNTKSDKLTGLVAGKLADGKEVEVVLGVLAPKGTKMKIYVGKMTDKDKAATIFTAIEKHLKVPEAAAP